MDDLVNRFEYHPADTEERRDAHTAVRLAALRLAEDVLELVPAGREQSLAITKVEEAMFWANAGIARQGGCES